MRARGSAGGATGGASPELRAAIWRALQSGGGRGVEPAAIAAQCGEQRLDGLIAALSVSLGPVTDPRYARCVGRISKVLHGERAADVLGRRLRNLAKPEDRRVVLLAIGATKTRAALDALLKMDQSDDAVIAALREHGAKKAQKTEQRRR